MADELVLDIVRVLQLVTSEPELDLFPVLRELSMGNSQEFAAELDSIAPFIGARRLSGGHPIVVSNWDTSILN